MRYEVLMMMNIKIKIFWDMMPCSLAEAADFSKKLVPIYQITWHHTPEDYILKL
jgi:hypothetical protein